MEINFTLDTRRSFLGSAAYSRFKLRGRVNLSSVFLLTFLFVKFLFSIHSLANHAKVQQWPKSPMVLSRHHRTFIVRLFQAYAACV